MHHADYEAYVLDEWALLEADPARARAAREAVAGVPVARVLDVGCGGGQELLPFIGAPTVLGVGVDPAPQVGLTRGRMAARAAPGSRAAFVRGRAETLPFAGARFDVVICRLALPYTDNAATLSEIARVLRGGGLLLLKYHHAWYYVRQTARALAARRWRSARHGVAVLITGALWHLTGWRCWRRQESFQTDRRLRRELEIRGLHVRRPLPDSNRFTPSYLVVRDRPGAAAGSAPAAGGG